MHPDPRQREQLPAEGDMAAWIATTFADLPGCVDTESDANPANFWNVEAVGDALIDYEVGQAFAAQSIRYALKYSLPVLIIRTIESMIRHGKFGPMECGYLSTIASSAAVGSQN